MSESSASQARNLRHDLRTPINHIVGYSELMLEEVEDIGFAEAKVHLTTILQAGRQILMRVNATRDLTDPDAGFDVGALRQAIRPLLDTITSACAAAQQMISADGRLDLSADLGRVERAVVALRRLSETVLDA